MIKITASNISDHLSFNSKFDIGDIEKVLRFNITAPHRTMLTIWKDNEVLAFVGVNQIISGVGELWLLPSVIVDKNKIGLYRTVKDLIYLMVFPEMGFHRLQIAIRKGWKKGYKWAQSLGFEEECTMEAYGPEKLDHVIFKKVV